MLERYDWNSFTTTGYALDRTRRHTIDEIARAIGDPPGYLEHVLLSGGDVGGVLLGKFCRDQNLSPYYVRRYE